MLNPLPSSPIPQKVSVGEFSMSVIDVIETDEHFDGSPFFMMPHCENNLAEWVNVYTGLNRQKYDSITPQNWMLSSDVILKFVVAITHALAEVHDIGVIHRNI